VTTPDKTGPRQQTVRTVGTLIQALPPATMAPLALWLVKLSRNSRTALRTCALDVMAALLAVGCMLGWLGRAVIVGHL